jgi:hypothetical protein
MAEAKKARKAAELKFHPGKPINQTQDRKTAP